MLGRARIDRGMRVRVRGIVRDRKERREKKTEGMKKVERKYEECDVQTDSAYVP